MTTGLNWKKLSGVLLSGVAILCMAGLAAAATQHTQHKAAVKKAPPAPLPSGPTGPVQAMPLDSIAAVPPQVTYQNSQLTIVAPNSTLADILKAIRKQTGAEIDVPAAPERVVTRLGPGPARDVVAELLNGSRFNYVLLGSPENDTVLTRVVLVAKSGIQDITPPQSNANRASGQANFIPGQPGQSEQPAGVMDAEPIDDTANAVEENVPEPPPTPDAEQSPDQNGVKTPQQMLQEMQQRQMQMQQQQGIPGNGMPPHPPREQ